MSRTLVLASLLIGCGSSSGPGGTFFKIDGPSSVVSGAGMAFTVSALDSAGQIDGKYRGTVHLDSDDGKATLPGDFAFADADQGKHMVTVTLASAGSHVVRASDTVNPTWQGSTIVTVQAGAAAALVVVGGDGQAGPTSAALGSPLVVHLTDGAGNPVAGAQVAWSASTGGGSVAPASSTTGADGNASANAKLGPTSGANTFVATAGSLSATFHATAAAGVGAVAHLDIVSGDGQSGAVNTALAQPLVVKASDGSGNPTPGVTLSWTSTGGGTPVPAMIATGMDGKAQITATLGTAAGAASFVAATGTLSATFHATGTAGALATLTLVSGDKQTGTAGAALANPLVVKAADAFGNPVAGATVSWSAVSGGGSVSPPSGATAADGTASTTATLGPAALTDGYQAAAALPAAMVGFSASRNPFKLKYTNPTGGKLQLVMNAASTDTVAVLDFVVAQSLTGYSSGFNLPVDTTRAQLDAAGFTAGTALNPGSAPAAASGSLPSTGKLANNLVAAISQKATGTGAIATDTTLAPGAVLFTVKLDLVPAGATGVVFDGTAGGFMLPSGGMRNRVGTTVAAASDVAIGKLEIVP